MQRQTPADRQGGASVSSRLCAGRAELDCTRRSLADVDRDRTDKGCGAVTLRFHKMQV